MNRLHFTLQVAEKFEKDLTVLGATAIEDRLQVCWQDSEPMLCFDVFLWLLIRLLRLTLPRCSAGRCPWHDSRPRTCGN
jgi:hypothetical protein